MPCLKCQQKPGYHSFDKIAEWNTVSLFYTSPVKTEDFNEDGTKLENITTHVSEVKTPWVWVLDCSNMALKHYTEISFNVGLLRILSEDKQLKGVWILHPNIWFRTTVAALKTFFSSPVLQNIRYFEGSKLEISLELETLGLESKVVQNLVNYSNNI